jgi:hypothetical protein
MALDVDRNAQELLVQLFKKKKILLQLTNFYKHIKYNGIYNRVTKWTILAIHLIEWKLISTFRLLRIPMIIYLELYHKELKFYQNYMKSLYLVWMYLECNLKI